MNAFLNKQLCETNPGMPQSLSSNFVYHIIRVSTARKRRKRSLAQEVSIPFLLLVYIYFWGKDSFVDSSLQHVYIYYNQYHSYYLLHALEKKGKAPAVYALGLKFLDVNFSEMTSYPSLSIRKILRNGSFMQFIFSKSESVGIQEFIISK